jgi:hypothetical protein
VPFIRDLQDLSVYFIQGLVLTNSTLSIKNFKIKDHFSLALIAYDLQRIMIAQLVAYPLMILAPTVTYVPIAYALPICWIMLLVLSEGMWQETSLK